MAYTVRKPSQETGASTVTVDEIIPAGKSWSAVVHAGRYLSIIDLEGQQGVDFLCYNADHPEERYHAPNTLKAARNLRLTAGHTLYSDIARPIFTITHDSCNCHDTIGGCCSAPSNEMLYGVKNVPGCRENFLHELGRHGLGRKDLVPNINFFCNVPVHDNRMADSVFVDGLSGRGDSVTLQADMNTLALISNCPQLNNPCNNGRPTSIRVLITDEPIVP